MTKLIAYRIGDNAPRIVPAQAEREWMSQTQLRFAYRCLPLTIANSMGWEVLCPISIVAEWDGGNLSESISVSCADGSSAQWIADSHFGHGILTFHLRHLFRTDPGIGLWVRGSPNLPKDGIAPLDGIIETDWLNFTFTMNWKFTRPGKIRFAENEPFCFLTPFGYHGLEGIVPEVVPIESDPEIAEAYQEYSQRRNSFITNLASGDSATVREGWQKWYMRGKEPNGAVGNRGHLSKVRAADPIIRDSSITDNVPRATADAQAKTVASDETPS